jgi:hypothetical protein
MYILPIIAIVVLILAFVSKVMDIILGSVLVIGGFVFNAYLDSVDSLELRLEALSEGITDLSSYSNIVIAVGAILIVVGVVRFIAEKNKKTKVKSNKKELENRGEE